ncbi:MAG TPA: hypothetical protein VHU88_20920 [Sporichthyaceae bacterium]|jgi:hypothetical protein|nr:hypothetical protein [Sporichthyaceae bacterium]
MPERDAMRDLREMNPVPHTAESTLDARASADLHRILTGDLQTGDANPTAPGRRPGMKRARIGGLTLVLAIGGSAAAHAAVGGGSGSPIPGGPNPPADKQAIQQAYAARQAAGEANPAPKNPAAAAAIAQAANAQNGPTQTPPTGILDTQEGPFSASNFLVQNEWQGPVGGNWVAVYAGEIMRGEQDPTKGQPGLYVYVYKSPGTGTPTSHTYQQAPGAEGDTAKILSESNGALTIQTSGGRQSKFDPATEKFE